MSVDHDVIEVISTENRSPHFLGLACILCWYSGILLLCWNPAKDEEFNMIVITEKDAPNVKDLSKDVRGGLAESQQFFKNMRSFGKFK